MQHMLELLRNKTGLVVTVHIPKGMNSVDATRALTDNVVLLCEQVADPQRICLSVDGAECGVDVAVELATRFGVRQIAAETPLGKLQGARLGVDHLLEDESLEHVICVDQDGDHFANELLNLVRAAECIRAQADTDRIIVLGQRSSMHRPMGLLRGELEELADRILLDALTYHAALTGTPLRMEHAFTFGEYPDFHSGYKLFSRPIAEAVFRSEPNLAGTPPVCYYRHAVEAVMVVEALEAGAYLGVVNRSTYNEQPISAFGMMAREQLMANTIIWPCKRLAIPVHFVRQWLDNHLPRLLLDTLRPDGGSELQAVRRLVLDAFGEGDAPPVTDASLVCVAVPNGGAAGRPNQECP
ncbi:MAG: hypothetical protein HQ523_10770 [Lentisphaerae bacterium]|nr:hypothetical protein [Lentisphaerota bacterium]